MAIEFPDNLQVLFEPKRYKVLWGGRGAGRSWGVARALLVLGTQSAVRVLCVRELQNSISESVHKVLSDQIVALGLENFYDIQMARILGKNGTSFSFEGIKNNTTKIKSYEGIDYCWVEEAVKVSRSSWGVLIPTIRKPASEIWITFNPELDTDYTYTRFVKDPDLKMITHQGSKGFPWVSWESETSIVVKMTHADNEWFPEVLRIEMEGDRKRDYDYYLNVWEGHTLQQLEGAVYAKELRKAQEEGRICSVPWEPEIPVDCFWDLGRADHTAIWFGQYVAMQYRVLDFYESTGEDITHYLKELQNRSYVYGTMYLPHDAKHKKLVYKHSIEKIVRDKFPDTVVLPATGVSDGINASRLFFPKCYFDESKCEEGLQALRRYRFKVKDGEYSNEPLHDDASDAADAFRYMAVAFSRPKGRSRLADMFKPASARQDQGKLLGRLGTANPQSWMG